MPTTPFWLTHSSPYQYSSVPFYDTPFRTPQIVPRSRCVPTFPAIGQISDQIISEQFHTYQVHTYTQTRSFHTTARKFAHLRSRTRHPPIKKDTSPPERFGGVLFWGTTAVDAPAPHATCPVAVGGFGVGALPIFLRRVFTDSMTELRLPSYVGGLVSEKHAALSRVLCKIPSTCLLALVDLMNCL